MRDLLRRIPWRRVGLVAAGAGTIVVGVLVPAVAPVTAVVGPGLIGQALPSEWAAAVARTVTGVVRRRR